MPVEDLESSLGPQDPDCRNGGFEGEERGNGAGMKGVMKMGFFLPFQDEGEVVTAWGEARLIKP